MRMFKRVGAVFAILVLLGVVMAASASAAESDALFLFSKTGFKMTAGAGTLSTLGNAFGIACTAMSGTGNTGGNETETFTATFMFTGCNANSLGDSAKTILYKVDGLLCVNPASLTVFWYLLVTEVVHLENVPLVGLVEFLSGSSEIASITPDGVDAKEFTLKLEASGTGDQKVVSCKDLEKTLTPSIKVLLAHLGSEVDGAISMEARITSEVLGTIDG